MSASLVGSEMCIRDSPRLSQHVAPLARHANFDRSREQACMMGDAAQGRVFCTARFRAAER
eukprot:14982541-Alexandrium_andersonii.AAC.1